MAAPPETTKSHTDNGPESPTTARPLDLDDDDVQDSSMLTDDAHTSTAAATTATATAPAAGATPANATETAPPKPPRPQTEAQKNEATLQEAFPTVEMGVIKAVLRASGGRVEPAFNALLEMTDPDAALREPEEVAPPQPPRPQGQAGMSQLEADERYARQLAEHYDNVGEYENRTSSRQNPDRQRQDWNEEDREHSFIDDDLPVIRENLRKGFLETQTTVNGWITNIRKKFEEFDTPEDGSQAHGQQQQQQQQQRRPGEASRRSNDYDRYDADPQVLGDDFANMRLNPDGSVNRTASPGIFRPPPPSTSPRPNDGRRVAFMEETEEINMYDASPKVPPKDTSPAPGGRASKWQPLSSVDPNPISDNDPFSLGDSEDEKDVKDKDKPKDSKTDDNERLKQAAAEAMADSLVDSSKNGQAGSKKP